MNKLSVRLMHCLILATTLAASIYSQIALAAGADYDGNGFSEIPVLSADSAGRYTWNLLDPFSGRSTVFTQNFGSPSNPLIIANWLYPDVTSAGYLTPPTVHSKGRLVWFIRTALKFKSNSEGQSKRANRSTVTQQIKYLGRKGDLIITGGDFTGDKIADAVVITDRGTGKLKWGLRGNFFLASYNPALKVNRAYFDFGTIGLDRPFFLNPDGQGDWFAVIRDIEGNKQLISYTQPFSQETRSFITDSAGGAGSVPLPVAQDDGSDLLLFYTADSQSTQLVIKDLSGSQVTAISVPINGEITIGNYGPGPGEEIAISKDGVFYVFNPITGRLVNLTGPTGFAADAININTVR